MAGFIMLVLASLGFGLSQYIVYKNRAVGLETRLVAVRDESAATLNNTTNKIKEIAQVPDMYKADLYGLVEKTFAGRYGKDGSKAVFQFIQENNMTLDPQMYRQIQVAIEAGRNEFLASQKMMIDAKRAYELQLNYVWSGFWMELAGYPKVDLNSFKVLQSNEVQTKFETGSDDVIKLR
jgi:hypothetical protein